MADAPPPPRPIFELRTYLYRVLGTTLGLWLVILPTALGRQLFAAPTAALLAGLLRSCGSAAQAHGATLGVGQLVWRVPTVWTAAPLVLLGAAAIAWWPTTNVKRVLGVVQVWFHCTLVNAMVLGWVVQLPAPQEPLAAQQGASVVMLQAYGLALRESWLHALRGVYPLAMALVLGLSLAFWLLRVAPRPLLGRGTDG